MRNQKVAPIIIEPRTGWHLVDFREFWRFRELLAVLIGRDIRVRYKQTVLGALWAVLQPAISMLIFTVVFGYFARIPSDGYPYPIFVFAALLPWQFFSSSISSASNSLIASSGLVSKIYFPRLFIPLSALGVHLLDFAISFLFLILLLLYFKIPLTLGLGLALIVMIIIALLVIGIGTLLSALIVSYRDFRFVVPFIVQITFFVTPVVYPVTLIPEGWRWIILVNPIAGLVDTFRALILGTPVDVTVLMVSCISTVLILFIGILYFSKVERRFADII